MVTRMGKSGMMGGKGSAQQKQIAAQMKRNPSEVARRLNQMDPRMLEQMGGKDAVMSMLQGSMGGGGGGGMPDPQAMQAMMSQMGLGGGMPPAGAAGMPPGMPQMPPGMDMNSIAQMMQSMGMGGAPPQGRR